jgi:hypothetical protein
MQNISNRSKGSLLLSGGKIFGISIFFVVVLVVVTTFVQVNHDMTIRRQISAEISIGLKVSDLLIIYRAENGYWPINAAEYSQDGIEVLDNGLVRVFFEKPESIAQKWADLQVLYENDQFYRSCRSPDIKPGRLPAWCRENAAARKLSIPGKPVQPAQ